jgi:hypothetical protein
MTESPTAAADLALATARRPLLRFDKHEPVPTPLDVDELFNQEDTDVRGAAEDPPRA